MRLTKENIYIDLRGKSKEELTELWELLDKAGEKQFRETLNDFLINYYGWIAYEFRDDFWELSNHEKSLNEKTEVTIGQLKEILQPMEKFTPIAMKCTQEQFNAIKPKLKGLEMEYETGYEYIFFNKEYNSLDQCGLYYAQYNNLEIHEQWNEEIFLKTCGIEVESLEQQLQKAEAEVKRLQSLIEEENRPKVGDWVVNTHHGSVFKNDTINLGINHPNRYKKITNPQLIELLENELQK